MTDHHVFCGIITEAPLGLEDAGVVLFVRMSLHDASSPDSHQNFMSDASSPPHVQCRLQGLPPNRINYRQAKVSSKVFARAVGNMMSVNVLQRILPALLKSAGLLEASGHLEAPTVFSHRLASKTCDEVADE